MLTSKQKQQYVKLLESVLIPELVTWVVFLTSFFHFPFFVSFAFT